MMPIGTRPVSLAASRRTAPIGGAAPAPAPVVQAQAVQPSGPPGQASVAFEAFVVGLINFFNRALSALSAAIQRLNAQMAAPGAPVAAPAPSVPAPAPAPVVSAPANGPVVGGFRDLVAQSPAGQPLNLAANTYTFDDFVPSGDGANGVGIDGQAVPTIAGAGVDRTVLRMTPRTSTHAGDIPTEDFASNPLDLIRISNGSPNLHDFTVQGSDQGHMYGGLALFYPTNARVTNVKVTGIPGNDAKPPGETFGLEEYRANGSVYKNVEVDGTGVGASCFASNVSKNVTVDHGYFHGSAYAHGVALWTVENANLIDCTAADNKEVGFNFERMTGTVNLVRPVVRNNGCDVGVASDQGSAVVNIYDPVLAPGQKLRIGWGPEYMGKPNLQRKEDVHVFINGVDRSADVLEWV